MEKGKQNIVSGLCLAGTVRFTRQKQSPRIETELGNHENFKAGMGRQVSSMDDIN